MIEVSPVLAFDGNCEEAFEYYKSVFGGEYQFIYRYKDVPDVDAPSGYGEKILHVSLPLMKNVNLMGADKPNGEAWISGASKRVSIGLRLNDRKGAAPHRRNSSCQSHYYSI